MKLILAIVAFCSILTAQATCPFGFCPGATKADIVRLVGASSTTADTDPDSLLIEKALKPHPAFETYRLTFSPQNGLVRVAAIGITIDTNGFGFEVDSAFRDILASLSKTYGQAETFDFTRSQGLWTAASEWMMALRTKERVLFASWQPRGKGVQVIGLEAFALSTTKGYIKLVYELDGFSEYNKAKKAKQETVF